MIRLFSSNNGNECPIDTEMRLWMENAFLWLATQFGHGNIATKPMLHPTKEYFPIHYDGSKESLIKTAEIVAAQMEIDINEVQLDIYEQNLQEFTGDFGHRIWTEVDNDSEEKLSAGLYFGKNEEGFYNVLIEKKNLSDPENLVATIAHEFSYIKLLGEKRLDLNDESLTDLTPVVFGLGIFNANSAYKEWRFRNEETSEWIKYLTPNIRSDFRKSMEFINANKDRVFIEEFNG